MKKILVTGFEPFGEETINPSIEVIKRLPTKIDNVEIIPLELPVVRYKAIEMIHQAIIEQDPDVILSIGQAGGRSSITVERVGINVDDFSILDNANNQPLDECIYPEGANAYFSNLPIKAIVKKIRETNISAEVSNTAGTFLCNHVLYGVRHLIETKYPSKKSGFIHIPFMREQVVNKSVSTPSMELEAMSKAIQQALIAIIENPKEDIKTVEGALS